MTQDSDEKRDNQWQQETIRRGDGHQNIYKESI